MNDILTRTTIRIEESLLSDISRLADDDFKSVNQEISDALKFYRDYRYMQDKACIINDNITQAIDARLALLEQRLNSKTNQVLSSAAIELEVVAQILAASLELSPQQLEAFRKRGVEYIKMNNRAFRLDEII